MVQNLQELLDGGTPDDAYQKGRMRGVMPYQLLENESIGAGIKRMAHEQVQRAILELDDKALDCHDTVHQVRKRCKKVRALLRLIRTEFDDMYDAENSWYRDSARLLADIRDCLSQIETYDDLMDRFAAQIHRQQFGTIRAALTRQCNQLKGIDQRLARFHKRMVAGLQRIDAWPLQNLSFQAVTGGLRKTYRRGRRAMRSAYDAVTPEAFHEWRKRVKYHWYHMRVFRGTWEPVLCARRDEADRLASYLGDDHDLAVLRATIAGRPEDYGKKKDIQAMVGLIDQRRRELERQAQPLGQRIFADSKKGFAKRMNAYWEAWQAELSAASVGKASECVRAM